MIRVQLVLIDDAVYARTGQVAEAAETFYLAFGTDPDKLEVREINLTAENAGLCTAEVGAWYGFGHEPGAIDAPGGLHRNDGRYRHEGGVSGSQETAPYNQRMRAWADRTGFTRKNGKPGYTALAKGGYYHSSQLRAAYAGYLTALAGGQPGGEGAMLSAVT